MSAALRRYAAILQADLRERSRATRFWVVLALTVIVTWWCFPPVDASYVAVSIGDNVRGRYSSAWVGMVLGLMYSTMLSLFGFYLVRGTLVRDFDTRVWQLLVATPMTRRGYLLAKWSSHLVVFMLIMAAGMVVGLAAQWHRAEDRTLDLIEMVKPIIVLGLPALAVTAFFAILFDLLPWLRRTAGNVLYFFVWIFLLVAVMSQVEPGKADWTQTTWLSDPDGMALAMRDLQVKLAVMAPDVSATGLNIIGPAESPPTIFIWDDWSIRPMDLLGRFLWLLLSMLGVALLAPMLDWAAARTRTTGAGQAANPGLRLRWLDPLLRPLESSGAGMVFAAELKLVLRQRRRWWWLAMIVLGLFQAFAAREAVGVVVILAWLASIDVFARTILRERETGTGALLFVAAGSRRRLLIARIGVALALALLAIAPALLRMVVAEPLVALALLLTAISIAFAGLAIGALCRNPRPFELLLVMLAYVGVQGAGPLAAVALPEWALGLHAVALPVTCLLLLLSWPRLARWH